MTIHVGAGDWDNLDSWWESYAETGHDTAVQIADLLEKSTDQWARSDAPFDTDPLAADLTEDRDRRCRRDSRRMHR